MHEVARELSFCYGHRLVGHPGKCAHLHGHNARVEVVLGSEALDAQGMVADFAVLRDRIGAWIDRTLDHRMILQRDDPVLAVLRELGEPVVAVDFPPTAENLARHIFEVAREADLPVVQVDFWETPTCRATYRA
jgi:6-pyruvoyltetrahydropterin/6-carboxytetrahydropterin synthase